MSKTLIIMVTLVTLVTLNQIAALWRYIRDPRYFGNYGNLGNSSSFFIFFVGGSTVLWQDGQMNKTWIIMVTMVTLVTLNQIAALWRCVHKNAFQKPSLFGNYGNVTLATFLGWDFSTSLWVPHQVQGDKWGGGGDVDRLKKMYATILKLTSADLSHYYKVQVMWANYCNELELTLQNPNKGYVKLALRPRDCL